MGQKSRCLGEAGMFPGRKRFLMVLSKVEAPFTLQDLGSCPSYSPKQTKTKHKTLQILLFGAIFLNSS